MKVVSISCQTSHSWENLAKVAECMSEEESLFTIGLGWSSKQHGQLQPHSSEASGGTHVKQDEDSDLKGKVNGAMFLGSEKELKLLRGFGLNSTVLDTGCNKNMVGRGWTDEYLSPLSKEDRVKVVTMEVLGSRNRFRFGGGSVFTSSRLVAAPVCFWF